MLGAVANEAVHPGGLRGRWSANAQPRIDSFYRAGRVVVELVVRLLFRIARPEIKVGLVPDFEIPLRDFVDAVAINEMLGEMGNQIAPFVPIFRRGNDGLDTRKDAEPVAAASLRGMKLSSTNGRTPFCSRPS